MHFFSERMEVKHARMWRAMRWGEIKAKQCTDVLDAPGDDKVITRVVGEVKKLTVKFPVYGN